MVEEECRRYRPTKNYLEHLGPIDAPSFETDLMKTELERIQNGLPIEPLSMKRYELPPPPPGKLSEVAAWTDSVTNSMAQLEHQAVRALNLDLMMEFGCEAWKSYLEVLTALQAKAQARMQDLRKEIQEVNWLRKSKQMQAGEKMRNLEVQWVQLVSKNYEIEQECAKLEEQLYLLKEHLPKDEVHPENAAEEKDVAMDVSETNGDVAENEDAPENVDLPESAIVPENEDVPEIVNVPENAEENA